jgi:hypothetical protein
VGKDGGCGLSWDYWSNGSGYQRDWRSLRARRDRWRMRGHGSSAMGDTTKIPEYIDNLILFLDKFYFWIARGVNTGRAWLCLCFGYHTPWFGVCY